MSLLRIYGSLVDPTLQCEWVLVDGNRGPISGTGGPADLPRHADRVQLVVPAAQVLLVRAHVPAAARRRAGPMLAYAIEEQIAGEPETQQVFWLGLAAGNTGFLAAMDRTGLTRWRDALNGAGIRAYEVHCETLMLPWTPGQWSLAWDGREGFLRAGEFEGAATDCGDRRAPPLSLRLALEEAQARSEVPGSIAVFTTAPDAVPELEEWERSLGVAVRDAGAWSWKTAQPRVEIPLARERRYWRGLAPSLAGIRPALWIAGAALAIHATALVADWTLLLAEQRVLRQQMEARFRAAIPDAVAVVDPALQMRRKLAEARRATGVPDSGDFLPMIDKTASGLRDVPAARLRIASYESGRLTLELAAIDDATLRRLVARLRQEGLSVDVAAASKRPAGGTVAVTVRAP